MLASATTTGSTFKPGHELDVVHRKDIGRIDHRECEAGADAREGQDRIFLSDFLRDEVEHLFINLEEFQITREFRIAVRGRR